MLLTKEESAIYYLFKLKFGEDWAKKATGSTLRSMRQFLLGRLKIVERALEKFED